MITEYNYYYFKGALSKILCDDIVEYANSKKQHTAITGAGNSQILEGLGLERSLKKRNSNIIWLEDLWIWKEIFPFVLEANRKAKWNFEILNSETTQFTKYDVGQYYGWHQDSDGIPYLNGNNKGLIRKLSVTVSLSYPEDYEGGFLEFDFKKYDADLKQKKHKCMEILPRGSVCVFPSHTWHRVTPVTKGTRLSLVQWNLGNPFK